MDGAILVGAQRYSERALPKMQFTVVDWIQSAHDWDQWLMKK
jgi:hypothetical protein